MLICHCCRSQLLTAPSRLYKMTAQIQRQASSTTSFMVVGLGNASYHDTRHSVGMQAADTLADWLDVRWFRQRALQCMVATTSLPDQALHLVLIKPNTFMNVNGKSIHKAAQHYGIEPSNIYLMHDELDKPIGATKMKAGGSARGHNGVRSTISSLKSDVMPRLLIGIDRPSDKCNVADYVLQRFTLEERPKIDAAITDGLRNLMAHIQANTCIEKDLITSIKKLVPVVSNPSVGDATLKTQGS